MTLSRIRNHTIVNMLIHHDGSFATLRHLCFILVIIIFSHCWTESLYAKSSCLYTEKNSEYILSSELSIQYQTSDSIRTQNLPLIEVHEPKRLSCMVALGAYSDVEKLVNVEYTAGPFFHIDFLWRVFERKGFWMGLSYDFFRSATGSGLATSEDKEAKYFCINLRYDVPTATDKIVPYLTTGVGWGSSFYKENEPWWDPNSPFVDRNDGHTNSTFFGVGAEIMLSKLRNSEARHSTIVEMRSFIGERSGLGFSFNLGYRIAF
jgi:opacity protein-like surface antigen